MKFHTKRWFRNRIGKTIYRKPINPNCCDMCRGTEVELVKVGDADPFFYADYVYDCQFPGGETEKGIEYFDSRKEMERS